MDAWFWGWLSSCVLRGIDGAFVCVMHSLRQQCLSQEKVSNVSASVCLLGKITVKSSFENFCLPQELASSMSLPSICLSSLTLRSRRYLPARLGSPSVSSSPPFPPHPCPCSRVCSPGFKVPLPLEELDVSHDTLFSDHARPPGLKAFVMSSRWSTAAA